MSRLSSLGASYFRPVRERTRRPTSVTRASSSALRKNSSAGDPSAEPVPPWPVLGMCGMTTGGWAAGVFGLLVTGLLTVAPTTLAGLVAGRLLTIAPTTLAGLVARRLLIMAPTTLAGLVAGWRLIMAPTTLAGLVAGWRLAIVARILRALAWAFCLLNAAALDLSLEPGVPCRPVPCRFGLVLVPVAVGGTEVAVLVGTDVSVAVGGTEVLVA